MKLRVDLTGQRFGEFTVLGQHSVNRHAKVVWRCQCSCGAFAFPTTGNLRSGGSTRCAGCTEGNRRHGHTWGGGRSPTYQSWLAMVQRCGNSKQSKRTIDSYRKRGITVCKRWRDFANFLADMGERPSLSHSIERTDNDKGYFPANCRWATRSEQCRNTRRNARYEYQGKSYCVVELSELLGVKDRRLRYLLRNMKLPLTEALSRLRPIDRLPAQVG